MIIDLPRRSAVLAVCVLGVALWAGPSLAAPESFKVPLSGAQQEPPVPTTGTGTADVTYDPGTRMLSWSIMYSGLTGQVTMAHLHGPAAEGKNAGVQIWLAKKGNRVESPIKGSATLTTEQAEQLADGQLYINIHTESHPGGEIRGQVKPPKS